MLPKPCRPETEKSNMATNMRSLKINRLLLPIYIRILPLKFGVDIQSQTKVSPETKKSNMTTRRPFWKWLRWKKKKSIGSYPYIQVLCHLSLELIFEAKLKLESGNQTIQYGCQAAILKLTSLKINRLLHIYISIVPLKFGVDIQSQTKVKSLETKKSNMATRRPFWKWRRWKSTGFCLWPLSICIWSLKLKFQRKLDLHSGNHVTYRVQKPKNLKWPPDGHFENNVAENQ